MIRKKIVGLILASILLIGFTVYSIVSEDLTTVQMILGKTTETASTEISQNKDESENIVDENNTTVEGTLDVNESANNVIDNNIINETLGNEITENNTSDIDNTVSAMTMASLTSENPVDEQQVSISGGESTASSSRPKKVDENSALQVASEQTNTSALQNLASNQSTNITNNTIGNETTNNSIKNLNSNNVANNKLNTSNTANTTVNQNKLPAAGTTKILIWVLVIITVIAIISIISNIKYRDIPLK